MTIETLGIVGGGQLGRMSAQAAEKLGIKTVIFTPQDNSPASQVAEETVIGNYDNEAALKSFADKVEVISYEFENIPVKTVEYLKTLKPVYPDSSLLEVSQDRIQEKTFLNSIDIPTARWSAPQKPQDVLDTLQEWNATECILKTTRFGYDGKGQARYTGDTNIETLWTQFNGSPLIMESIVDFEHEISVVVARDQKKNTIHYGPMLNEHKNHILDKTFIPANLDKAIEDKAIEITRTLAQSIDLCGVLTLEMFISSNGEILANEIAPRTHNSGHWTIDACEHSQFENHVRAVCGLDVLEPGRHSDAIMHNLIGVDIDKAELNYGQNPNATVHKYGKTETRAGRKMGHVTIISPKP